MNKNVNTLGGVHFEQGRGYRASMTVGLFKVRSQRFKTKREANLILNIMRAQILNKNGSINTSRLNRLESDGTVSVSLR